MKYLLVPTALIIFLTGCIEKGNNSSSNVVKTMSALPAPPSWFHQAVLYECNIRQFSDAGNFAGVTQQLERIKDLGVDVLWLMPIHPIGIKNRKEKAGDLGSPYSVQDYYGINPDFGTKADLRQLIEKSHQLGLKVILDWVPNHTAWDSDWMNKHPEYFTKINGNFTAPINENGGSTGWDDCVDLDYTNLPLRSAMIQAMSYWIKEFDIDGFRVDMAGLVPNDFWAEVRPALDSIKPVFMLSEWQDEPAHFHSCFHMNYGWKWKDVTKDIASGKQNAIALDTLHRYLNQFYPENYVQLYFTQNHDENSWSGTEQELYGDAADAFNVLMFTWQGAPMLYNGQEDGLSQRLAFFKKDPIKWNNMAKTPFYQALAELRHNNKALWSGSAGGKLEKISTNHDEQVYAFTREKDGERVVVVINFSKSACEVTLSPNDAVIGSYLNLFGASTMQFTKDMQLNLKAWEYLVLTNK
ncbi:MAG: alpha-glucosidase C-terminal domain-containing protein [Saprospiraceae bacterium]|nr:alpha-glucosidase C-terminal domain-containing protein [Saprospiraceae bacterium]